MKFASESCKVLAATMFGVFNNFIALT
jgi:hypothetical protein